MTEGRAAVVGSASPAVLPQPLRTRDRTVLVDRARAQDVPGVVALLRDDAIGAGREVPTLTDADLAPYRRAFAAVDGDPQHLLVVVRDAAGSDVLLGTLQLTLLPGLSRGGATRLQIEGVRVAGSMRGTGLGSALVDWAVEHGRARGAVLAQLTTDLRRDDAHRFYERLGWVHTHAGFKRDLR